jgi:SAM-dependent methyltransferase
MENSDEAIRLEIKTNPKSVKKQARWCGLKPGIRVLDAGCGPGKVTSILHEMIQPGGEIIGIDYSEERVRYARKRYGNKPGIAFRVRDLRNPLKGMGKFDLIWVRFVLEYNRREGPAIVKNLTAQLRPGGYLCLLDLDHNCLNHYELPSRMEDILDKLVMKLEQQYNFDPFIGRKLYAYLYDQGYHNVRVSVLAHHLIYGKIRDEDVFNWMKKMEVVSRKTRDLFEAYPGGQAGFIKDFREFFLSMRRFTYTPLILCKGIRPSTP